MASLVTAIRELPLETILGSMETDIPKAAKAKQAAYNALSKLRRACASAAAKRDSAASLEAVRSFTTAYGHRRTALREHGIEMPALDPPAPADAFPDAPADSGVESVDAASEDDLPAPPPPPGVPLQLDLESLPPPLPEFLVPFIEAPERSPELPLKLAVGLTEDQHLEDGVAQVFEETTSAHVGSPRALQCGIDAVIAFINERFVDLTHVGRILYLVWPVKGKVARQYQDAEPKRLSRMLGITKTPLSPKPLDWSRIWLESPSRRKAMSSNMLPPRFPGDTESAPPQVFNLWAGHAITLEAARAAGGRADGPGAVALMALVDEALAGHSAEERHWLLSWFAHCVQCPGDLPRVTPVLHGDEGAGKGAMVTLVSLILGSNYYSHPTGMEQIMGRFANTEGKVLVFADEVVWKGDMAGQEILKKIISEDLVTGERKNVDAYNYNNCVHLIIATNHEQAVLTSSSSRRFAHYRLAGKRRDLRHLFTEAAINDIAVFYHSYERVEQLDRVVPAGATLYEQRLRSLRGVDRFLAEATGGAGPEIDYITFDAENLKSNVYGAFLKSNPEGVKFAPSAGVFWTDVGRRIKYDTTRRGHAGSKTMARFPSLEAAAEQLGRFLDIPAAMLLPPPAICVDDEVVNALRADASTDEIMEDFLVTASNEASNGRRPRAIAATAVAVRAARVDAPRPTAAMTTDSISDAAREYVAAAVAPVIDAAPVAAAEHDELGDLLNDIAESAYAAEEAYVSSGAAAADMAAYAAEEAADMAAYAAEEAASAPRSCGAKPRGGNQSGPAIGSPVSGLLMIDADW